MLPGIQHSMAGTSAKSECVVHSLVLETTMTVCVAVNGDL